jgi:hypothetical protein
MRLPTWAVGGEKYHAAEAIKTSGREGEYAYSNLSVSDLVLLKYVRRNLSVPKLVSLLSRLPSLKAFDVFIRTHCKNTPVVVHGPEGARGLYSVFIQNVDGWGRRKFDVFKRGAINVVANLGGKLYETTVAQLNFLLFVDRYRIMDHFENAARAVEAAKINEDAVDQN